MPEPTDPAELPTYRPLIGIKVRPAVRYRDVHTTGRRVGAPPLIPQPKSSGRFELMEAVTSIPQPVQATDGVACTWTVDQTCRFVENASPNYYSGGLVLGHGPFNTEKRFQKGRAATFGL